MHSDGTLIMLTGQYRGAYKVGYHNRSRGRDKMYKALEQISQISYVRDEDRDDELDISGDVIFGNFKTNIHRANEESGRNGLATIGKYSAGCQVIRLYEDFKGFISLCEKSAELWGNSFTYTLFDESDFES